MLKGFGITEFKKVSYVADVALIPGNYHLLKRSVSGFYGGSDGRSGFNNLVLKNYLTEFTGNWGKAFNSTTFFPTFELFYYRFMKNKEDHIERVIDKIMEENKSYPGISRYMIHASFIVRMGNTYNGANAEDRIANILNSLRDYISCIKTPEKVDQELKVDAVIEFATIDSFAIQIKPISSKSYDSGSELEFHKQYETITGNKVFYIYYTRDNEIILGDRKVPLTDELGLVTLLQDVIYSL